MKMKKIISMLLILLLALSAVACSNTTDDVDDASQNPDAEQSYGADDVVARVGNREITLGKLEQFLILNAYIQNYDLSSVEDEESQAYLEAMFLEEIINLEALAAYCDQQGYDVYPEDYEEALTAFLDDANENSGEWMAASGITEDFLTWYFDAQFYMNQVQEEIEAEIDLATEVQAYYENNQEEFYSDQLYLTASHILLETEEEALNVRQLLVDGADFAETAIEYSIDPTVGSNGGSLGTFYYGMMVEPFWEGAKAAAVGVVTAPVQSDHGYHLILVEDRVEAGDVATYDEVEEYITSTIIAQYYYERLDEIRTEMGVQYILEDGTAVDQDGEPIE